MRVFDPKEIKSLFKPANNSAKGENGKVTIIGGSRLFHGAPLFSLVTASRLVDIVFFSSPEPSIGDVAAQIKSSLFSFIWVPWEETGEYIQKSDAILIGPGFMRYRKENGKVDIAEHDDAWEETKEITRDLLLKYPDKRWVVDAGSLQVLNPDWIPNMAILTPNKKEYKMIFGEDDPVSTAKKHNCVIVLKGPVTKVCSPDNYIEVNGGNPGLTKGGSGDVEAGLTVALLAKNDPVLAAAASSYIIKKSADLLYEEVGTNYNSDDLAKKAPGVLNSLF